MIEHGMSIDEIVFQDTGYEFPEMYEHLDAVERYIGLPITRLKADRGFEYWLAHHVKTKGKHKGKQGYGWPDFRNRWCTDRLKQKVMRGYIQPGDIEYHGIAYDEQHRCDKNRGRDIRYPLVEWEMTEADCLKYCYERGFHWGGLYEQRRRVSCFLCPLQSIGELRMIYHNNPALWAEMERLDALSWRKYQPDRTLTQIKGKFESELKLDIMEASQ